MAAKQEEKDLWVGFAQDAISRYEIPEKIDDTDDLVDDMIEVATKYADGMLDQLDERGYGSGRKSSSQRRRRGDRDSEPPESGR